MRKEELHLPKQMVQFTHLLCEDILNLLRHESYHSFPYFSISSVQLSHLSHVQLCDPMDCSTPGFPVHHQLPEVTQTHVH